MRLRISRVRTPPSAPRGTLDTLDLERTLNVLPCLLPFCSLLYPPSSPIYPLPHPCSLAFPLHTYPPLPPSLAVPRQLAQAPPLPSQTQLTKFKAAAAKPSKQRSSLPSSPASTLSSATASSTLRSRTRSAGYTPGAQSALRQRKRRGDGGPLRAVGFGGQEYVGGVGLVASFPRKRTNSLDMNRICHDHSHRECAKVMWVQIMQNSA